MKERQEIAVARKGALIGRAARIARILACVAALGLTVLAGWTVSGTVVRAENPKEAARSLGAAGNAAAQAVARDASKAETVPGFAGTDLPEGGVGADGLEDAGRARLADPGDPGGAAGRTVVRGATTRPPASVPADGTLAQRADGIAAAPQSPAHGADGLASGSVAECGAGLRDAEGGGTCGSVRFCVGADCETVRPRSNTG
ncbi:MAG: hypothetical protein F4103_02295, partial [Boseongicola sp. SB0673_bin_14]|nr:hypothetical protein [Boseongicola sp. SB0673_bin_14]